MGMRNFCAALVLSTAFTAILPMTASANNWTSSVNGAYSAVGGSYNVQLNKTEIIRLPEPASAVVVGNPDVADISVHSSDTIFLVGRGYGETNLLVLNSQGQTIMNADINVTGSNSRNNVRVYSGGNTMRTTFNCSPYCQPAPVLGDDTTFMSSNSPTSQLINNSVATGVTTTRTTNVGVATTSENYNPAAENALMEGYRQPGE